MATIDPEVVRQVARLARLRVEPEQEERLVRELTRIVDYVDVLSQLTTAPSSGPGREFASPLREDRLVPSEHASSLLELAPDREGDALRVPAVLTEE